MHNKEKVVDMFIIYCDPSETFEPITEWNFGGKNQPENLVVQANDDYLINPNPTNEHVGVDEETLYLQNEPVNALTVIGCFDRGNEKVVDDDDDVVEGDSESDLECDLDLEDDSEDVEPEQGYEEINHHPIVDYDEEDPPMKPGSTYPNMAEFMDKLRQILMISGFRFVVNLVDKTCSCRQWQVSGISCKHALAFITSLANEPIDKHVDLYYSIEKFRAAYNALIPALPDKNQWPKLEHGFFLHPPLLKVVAGRPKTERHKGTSDNKRKKGQHQCPICKEYGHH
jgi:hypothetical protein